MREHGQWKEAQRRHRRKSDSAMRVIVVCAILAMTPWILMGLGVLIYIILKIT